MPVIHLLCGTVLLTAVAPCAAAAYDDSWPVVNLASPRRVELSGSVGTLLRRGIERLAQPPYTTEWLLADVSFKINRAFTNYSGDVSGRFLELAFDQSARPTFAGHARTRPDLLVNPRRPDREEPRCIKRHMKEYNLMTRPRAELRKLLKKRRDAA